jgi:gentisate 1,2-dioxygenase
MCRYSKCARNALHERRFTRTKLALKSHDVCVLARYTWERVDKFLRKLSHILERDPHEGMIPFCYGSKKR